MRTEAVVAHLHPRDMETIMRAKRRAFDSGPVEDFVGLLAYKQAVQILETERHHDVIREEIE